jgi:enamine deaminase RidA (YjgF/YER057c/UK114 family)
VLENLKAVLAKAGVDFTHVVKTTVFLKSMAPSICRLQSPMAPQQPL